MARGSFSEFIAKNKLSLLITPLLVVGVATGLYALHTSNFDIRNWAFTGFEFNTANLGTVTDEDSQGVLAPNPLSTIPEDPSSARYLYYKLVDLYPGATTQNIQAPGISTTGVASLVYDSTIDKTLIFITIKDLPYFEFTPFYFWLHNSNANAYQQVAPAEFVSESGTNVAYFVYSANGDLRNQFDLAYLSYDQPQAEKPVLPIITLTL